MTALASCPALADLCLLDLRLTGAELPTRLKRGDGDDYTGLVRHGREPFLKAKHIMRDHSSSPAKLTCNPQCLIAAE